MKIRLYFALLLVGMSQHSLAFTPTVITLATTSWCPYTCGQNKDDSGIIGVYLREVFSTLGIQLHIETYPWSRAIHMAQQGQVDGLLTAIPEEAPNLLFTKVPTATFQMCFYTQKDNDWQYSTPINIGANKLAVIQNYGYGEPVDSFIKNKSDIVKLSGLDSSKRLLDLLIKKRVDIIIGDSMVLGWSAQINNFDLHTSKQAGCLPESPFYLALTPSDKHKKLIVELDSALKNQKQRAMLKALLAENALNKSL